MPERFLHIISFDVPWPANYGGVIDVYYKLVALKKAGIKTILHTFHYGRKKTAVLDQLCHEVHYYPRLTGFRSNLSKRPYIVESRKSEVLIERLIRDDHPILFEGLHSCYYLDDQRIAGRKKIYRESNIEHHYYYHLFRGEQNLLKKIFFLAESARLKNFQKKLKHSNLMLVVSKSDTDYLKRHFPDNKVVYLPSFHPNDDFEIRPGKGDYALYHGRLSVPENFRAANYLIKEVFAGIDKTLIIAGMNPPEELIKTTEKLSNVRLIANPDDEAMFRLIREAQINILITFQATGLKLKLLNTLYKGRFCLVNPAMVQGTGLENLCTVADGSNELKRRIHNLFEREFNLSEIEARRNILQENYSNTRNASRLIQLVFGSDS